MNDGAPFPLHAYVVDDDEGFRASLELLLQSHGWIVESFGSAGEFAERAEAVEPGIVLLDVNLGTASGLDFLEECPVDLDRFAVLMMTGAGAIQTAVRSIKAGAVDFVEKTLPSAELIGRLREIHEQFAASFGDRAARWEARRFAKRLSAREREVLERLLSGASNKLIARDLGLSPRTVEMHRARMLHKLGAATTAEAVEIGRRAGLAPVAPVTN